LPKKKAKKKKTSKAGSRKTGRPGTNKARADMDLDKPMRSKRKTARAIDDAERMLRLAKVARLRFVQHWTVEEIAQTLEVSPRTIERDLQAIRRKQRARAKRELAHVVDDIASDLQLSYDEKMKRLWQEFIRLTADKNGKPVTLGLQKRYQFLSLIRQITETENSYVDQLRKLGIVGPSPDRGEDDGELLLVQIRERYANRVKKNTADSSGGGDGKPSGKAE